VSAFPPLLGDKLTSGEYAKNGANDTYDMVAHVASEMQRIADVSRLPAPERPSN
jgi:hypothetical protein